MRPQCDIHATLDWPKWGSGGRLGVSCSFSPRCCQLGLWLHICTLLFLLLIVIFPLCLLLHSTASCCGRVIVYFHAYRSNVMFDLLNGKYCHGSVGELLGLEEWGLVPLDALRWLCCDNTETIDFIPTLRRTVCDWSGCEPTRLVNQMTALLRLLLRVRHPLCV